MSLQLVKKALEGYGLAGRVKEFEVSSATVELAAQAVGVQPGRIAKSLTFLDGEQCIMVVTAGDQKIDNKKYKAQFGCKAKMLTPEQALHFTGHAVGGVCPFALPEDGRTQVYLDTSMQRFETIFPAAGTASSAVELTCEELAQASGSQGWVDVCKPMEG